MPDNPLVRLRILRECPKTRQNINDAFLVRSSFDRRYVTLYVTPGSRGPFVASDNISISAGTLIPANSPKAIRAGVDNRTARDGERYTVPSLAKDDRHRLTESKTRQVALARAFHNRLGLSARFERSIWRRIVLAIAHATNTISKEFH